MVLEIPKHFGRGYVKRRTTKTNVTISVDLDVINKAREHGIVISAFVEQQLKLALEQLDKENQKP